MSSHNNPLALCMGADMEALSTVHTPTSFMEALTHAATPRPGHEPVRLASMFGGHHEVFVCFDAIKRQYEDTCRFDSTSPATAESAAGAVGGIPLMPTVTGHRAGTSPTHNPHRRTPCCEFKAVVRVISKNEWQLVREESILTHHTSCGDDDNNDDGAETGEGVRVTDSLATGVCNRTSTRGVTAHAVSGDEAHAAVETGNTRVTTASAPAGTNIVDTSPPTDAHATGLMSFPPFTSDGADEASVVSTPAHGTANGIPENNTATAPEHHTPSSALPATECTTLSNAAHICMDACPHTVHALAGGANDHGTTTSHTDARDTGGTLSQDHPEDAVGVGLDVNGDSNDVCLFDSLPTELCLNIFSFFSDFQVVSTLGQVSRQWNALAQAMVGTKMDLSNDRLAALVVDDRFIHSLRRFHITELDISGCQAVTEAGVLAAASLNLSVFRARGIMFESLKAQHIVHEFGNLVELDLLDSVLPDLGGRSAASPHWQIKPHVRTVKLSCLHHTGIWSSFMQQFPNVEVAVLRDVQNTAALNDLASLTHLRSLTLTKCSIRARGLALITTLESLAMENVYVSGITYLPARPRGAELAEIIQQLPSLRDLTLKQVQTSGGYKVGTQEVTLIMAARPHMRSLCIESGEGLSDNALKAIAASTGSSLRRLELPDNPDFTNAGIVQLVEQCRGLMTLSLSACTQLSDVGVEAIARSCLELTTLNIARCTLVTEQGLYHLTAHRALHTLVAYGVHHAMRATRVRSQLAVRGVAVFYRGHDGRDGGGGGDGGDTSLWRAVTGTACTAEYSDTGLCECPRTQCTYCHKSFVGCLASDHAAMCTETPSPCPCCRSPVASSLLARHFTTECDAYTVGCPYCATFLPRHAVDRHLATCSVYKARQIPVHAYPGCPLRTAGCLARGHNAHIPKCSRYMVRCRCGDVMPRAVLNAHMTVCLTSHRPVLLPGLVERATARGISGRYRVRSGHKPRVLNEGEHYFVNFQGEEVHFPSKC
eukprot:m.87306 g.87306  ORF g.87306 m.87306 type:complete len:997 (-) comp9697_c2_seq1:103-3093(-)